MSGYDKGYEAGKEVFSVKSPSVEVVRCGDCEHYFEEWGACMRDSYWTAFYEEDEGYDTSIEGMFDTEPDDSCKWGKRRQP